MKCSSAARRACRSAGLAGEDLVLLDVRQRDAFAKAHINGALSARSPI
jgi:rhodanese-related sulfurtransferase